MSTRLFAELKRRNVIRAAGLYLVGAWLVTQVASTVLPAFDVPAWALRAVIIVLALGFVPALIFAWLFELTPAGFKRDADVAPEESIAPRTARSMDRAIIVVLVCALGYFALDKFVLAPKRAPYSGATRSEPASATQTAAAASGRRADNGADPISSRKSIAVLPFENLSDDKANAYFASGMQDMILTKLAAIAGLKVISRTSTEKYASHPDDLKTIGRQLGVATILEGSVQKSGNQVLINVQLIDANTDEHLWADAYPRTLENIFGVEGEVAQMVADALKTRLTAQESASVASLPTRNIAAYDAFLKGEYQTQQAANTWRQETFLAAEADYRKAVSLDPDFALAYAQLALCRMRRHWFAIPLTEAELAEVKTTIDRALALAPNLPAAHLALAYHHYWGFRRYDEAVAEFERTLQLQPSSADAVTGLGYIARRRGQWEQALAYMQKAVPLSPRDGNLRGEIGATLVYMRRYAEAVQQVELALELDPTNANAKDWLRMARLFGFGDVPGARAAYRTPPDWRIAAQITFGGDVLNLINPRAYVDVIERQFDAALHAWDAAPTDTAQERLTGSVARVVIRIIAGQRAAAQGDCERLAPQLQAEIERAPGSLSLLQQLAWVHVCLGRNTEAIQTARRAVAGLPIEKDAYNGGPNELVGLAQVAAHAGAADESIRLIDQLLSIPAGGVMSVERLRIDPVWDPLRKDARFEALLKTRTGDSVTHP